MDQSLCILGRQSGLSIAELESLLGADKISPISHHAALISLQHQDIPFARLGGTIKLCKVLTRIPSVEWRVVQDYLVKHVPEHVSLLPEGKVKFGISTYGLNVKQNAINATGLEVKKATKAVGRSMRVVPTNGTELNSAQVLNNKMTDILGMELILVKDGHEVILAQTVNIQDIDAYAERDWKRPMRDARVGMLPPKLAQIITNLASPEPASPKHTVLDPFCGTGVLLQEALLCGFSIVGTDLEPRMIEYSQVNLDWLQAKYDFEGRFALEVGDATSHQWTNTFDSIACETYLGRPFSTEPNPDKLREVINDVNTIHRKFLQNVAKQTKPGLRLCIAVPAWHTKSGIKHLPVLDHLTDMGYTRMSFVHSEDSQLIYHREDQIVGRELVVITRK